MLVKTEYVYTWRYDGRYDHGFVKFANNLTIRKLCWIIKSYHVVVDFFYIFTSKNLCFVRDSRRGNYRLCSVFLFKTLNEDLHMQQA